MSPTRYDAVVVGLGAMGSATAYQLTKAGATVLGIDRYSPPHDKGSTHGDTRITRLAIGEGVEYVPLVRRSHEIWGEIETATGKALLHQCGGLVIAGRDAHGLHGRSDFLDQTIASAREYGIGHDVLTAEEVTRRHPQLNLTRSETGYYEPSAGFLRPERCVAAQLQLASRGGATIRTGEVLRSFSDDGSSVTVVTSTETVTARTLVVAAGPWIGEVVPEVASMFTVHRQVMYWFDLADKAQYDAYTRLPVYIWEFGGVGRDRFIYGFPMLDGPGGGVKVATEDYSSTTSPDAVHPAVTRADVELMYETYVRDQLPGLSGRCVRTASCLYTVTDDHRFVIDRLPTASNVIVVSPCSGHGFKHSAAIGEVVAQLAAGGPSDIDVSAFALR